MTNTHKRVAGLVLALVIVLGGGAAKCEPGPLPPVRGQHSPDPSFAEGKVTYFTTKECVKNQQVPECIFRNDKDGNFLVYSGGQVYEMDRCANQNDPFGQQTCVIENFNLKDDNTYAVLLPLPKPLPA